MEKKKSKGKIVGIVMCVLLALFAIIVIAALNTEEPAITEDTSKTYDGSENSESVEKELYADENYKVSYIGLKDPQAGVTAYNLLLRVENNGDEEIIATLTDGYVNDTAVDFYTGTPVKVKPGKNAVGAFILGYANLGIDSIDDIEKIEFEVALYNSDYSEKVIETENITLDF